MTNTRGQHHIPQFLLRGFSSSLRKKQVLTFVTYRGRPAFETNVKNIAKQRDFYGNPASTSVEEDLARLENQLAEAVIRLRNGESVSEDTIRALVVNLQVRSVGLRNVIRQASKGMMRTVRSMFDHMGVREKIERDIITEIRRKFTAGEYAHLLSNSGVTLNQVMDAATSGLRSDLSAWLEQMKSEFDLSAEAYKVDEEMANVHRNVLAKDLLPAIRLERLKPLRWTTQEFQERALILGDAGPLLRKKGENLFVHAIDFHGEEGDVIEQVVLPISSNLLLRGESQNSGPLDLEEVNIAQSELSSELFVSSLSDVLPSGLGDRLGTRSIPFDASFFEEILQGTVNEKSYFES